jgi:hypothetical protein
MDASVLQNLANVYSLVSITCIEALDFCLTDELRPFPRWADKYSELMKRLQMQVPIPADLEPHIPELRRRLKKLGISRG